MRTVVATDLKPPSNAKRTGNTAKAPLLRHGSGLIRWLLSLLLLSLLLGGGIWTTQWFLTTQQFKVAKVRIEGQVHHTGPSILESVIVKQITGNFFAVDLGLIRNAVENLPWIAEAYVRRVWPLTLVVWVREHEVLAHWGKDTLVSQQGVIFTPNPQSIPAGLTYLQGPDSSVQYVINHYRWLQQQLAQHKLGIARLILSDRHAWYVDLTNGLRLSLGTKDIEGRIKRFLSYLPQLPQPEALAQIDLRYINGFAAKWQALPEP